MNSRPKVFGLLAIFMFGVILSFPAQIMSIYGHGISELATVLAKMGPMNWVIVFLALLNIKFLLEASRVLQITMPLMALGVAWNNWIVASAGTDFAFSTVVIATLGFVSLSSLLFLPASREAIAKPERRWWQVPKRKKVKLPVQIKTPSGRILHTCTFDLSKTGAFVTLDHIGRELAFTGLSQTAIKAGDLVNLHFSVGPHGRHGEVYCKAKVVRKQASSGTYPTGMGLEFSDLKVGQRQVLSRLVEALA
jgi:hypothetical protein